MSPPQNGMSNGHSNGAKPSEQALVVQLKAKMADLDDKRMERLKRKPPGKQQTPQELEQAIRRKEQEMQHASLNIKQEKEAMKAIKQMKDDKKRMDEWEHEMEELRSKRSQLAEQLRQAQERQDAHRSAQLVEEAAQAMSLEKGEVVDARVGVSEEMAEMLNQQHWTKKLRAEHQVIASVNPRAKHIRLAGSKEAVEAATLFIQDYGAVVSKSLTVSDEELGLLIGKKGATIATLQERTGCTISTDKKALTVSILGLASQVEAAAEEVRDLFETKKRVEVTLSYSAEQKGTLLGKGGSTIKRISQDSGAQLDLGKEPDYTIRVHGPAAAVEKAKALLKELLFLDAKSVQTVEIPGELLDAVVGKGGENVRRLQTAHGVSIDNLAQARRQDGARDEGKDKEGRAERREKEAVKFKIRGSIDGVRAALKEITEVMDREKRVEEVVQVQSQHVGMLLGKSGATINQIQRDSGAVLDMQKKADEGSSSQAVTIRGNKVQVRKAMEALEGVLKYKAECNEELAVDKELMPLLIGKGGEEINRIRAETGAAIDAERDPGSRFKLRGSKEAVGAAMAALTEAIGSNKRVGEHVPLPWHCIDMLIGPNAELLRKFEADHQVSLELPGLNLPSEVVCSGSFLTLTSSLQVKGRKKHVDVAVAKLEVLSNKFAVETLELDDGDAELLARLCLADAELLAGVEAAESVSLVFEPLEGTLVCRGEELC